jgi:hypothetical protein
MAVVLYGRRWQALAIETRLVWRPAERSRRCAAASSFVQHRAARREAIVTRQHMTALHPVTEEELGESRPSPMLAGARLTWQIKERECAALVCSTPDG